MTDGSNISTDGLENIVQKFQKIPALILLLSTFFTSFVHAGADPKLFPRPAELEDDVQFWIKIFAETDTDHGLIHDDRHLEVIYEKISLPVGVSYKTQQNYIKSVKKRYERILTTLSRGKRSGLTSEERRVLSLWPKDVSNNTLRTAKNGLRFQLGQSNKFRDGLIRSGAWRSHILDTLQSMGLPREISRLPHVESSFNPKAFSHVGAAGLWQFTRSTGRRFMRVDHIVDERMDPFSASIAAARLLENNYAVIGTWPLAITAYNHGAAGMRNAAKVMGTYDFATINRKYKSRSFKFASRNFYLAFLAVNDVEDDHEKYFGKLQLAPPIRDEVVTMPAYMSAQTIAKTLGVPLEDLKDKNPALRPSVWNGTKLVPRGYKLRIDQDAVKGSASDIMARIPAKQQYAKQSPDLYHKVRRGQTISSIAARYGVRVKDIVALNSLKSVNRIRVGQNLRLPQRGERVAPVQVASNTSTNKSKPSKAIVKASFDGKTYKVRRGDTLARISKRTGVSKETILAANNLKNQNRIYPGQKLQLSVPQEPTTVAVASIDESTTEQEENSANNVKLASLETKTLKDSQITPENDEQSNDAENPDSSVSDLQAAVPIVESLDNNLDNAIIDNSAADASRLPDLPAIVDKSTHSGNTKDLIAMVSTLLDETKTDSDQTDQSDSNANVAENDQSEEIPVATISDGSTLNAEELDKQSEKLENSLTDESEEQLALAADPSDYSVSKRNTIEVQAEETLGHYAEWLNLRASRLRRVNRMRYGKPVVIGNHLKLDFRNVSIEEFEKHRRDYHRSIQEAFFEQYQISGSDKHVIKRGESLWRLAQYKYKIPVWLLRQYNPDLVLNMVHAGIVVTFPKLEERETAKDDPKESADTQTSSANSQETSAEMVAVKQKSNLVEKN